MKTTTPCDKLDFQHLGSFVSSDQGKDVAFCLDLPSQNTRLHPIFHVSLLSHGHQVLSQNRVVPPPPLFQLMEGPKYEVEAIFRLAWILVDDQTWEVAKNVANALDLIEEFHLRYPKKPNPSLCIATRRTCHQRSG